VITPSAIPRPPRPARHAAKPPQKPSEAALAKIAQPEIGVVTNVAPVHLEFFKSVADIARAKYETIEWLMRR